MVVKDLKEIKETADLWEDIRVKFFHKSADLPCYIITEEKISDYMKKKKILSFRYTDFLISSNIHNCMLINYL